MEISTNEIPEAYLGVCSECTHFDKCKSPCRPIRMMLDHKSAAPFERQIRGDITIVFPQYMQTRKSELLSLDTEKSRKPVEAIFSTVQDSPFLSAELKKPKLQQTSVFIDRFFNKMPFEAMAEKYGVTVKTVENEFENARKRIHIILKRIDDEERAGQVVKSSEGRMTTQVKAFLLYHLFGLTITQIARILGVTKSTVLSHIQRVNDLIVSGELRLIECSDQDQELAKYRLEKLRCYQNARHKKTGQD